MRGLTNKQKRILKFIEAFGRDHGMAPTVYELSEKFNVKTSTMFAHIQALANKGFLTRSSKARSIVLSKRVAMTQQHDTPMVEIPLVGRVCAGLPVDAPECREGVVYCDPAFLGGDNIGRLFALKVRGESMRDAGILDGDVVIVRQTHNIRRGDIVVALVDNETTVKKYYPAPGAKVELRPANPEFQPQIHPVEDVHIQGRIVSLQRRY